MSDNDADLFRRAISGTKPLSSETRAAGPRKKPKPKARFSRADDQDVLRESILADTDAIEADRADNLRYCRASVGRRTMRKLTRSALRSHAAIDPHALPVAEAKPRLAEFIEHCSRNGKLCVRIVHGKGLGSGQRGPVLKMSVSRWLRQWDSVLAFVSARQVDGGTGAVYVLLQQL